MHRDLKPENILIGADGHIKLTDFGLSDAGVKQKLEDVTNSMQPKESKKTRVVGTADYMAPESLRGEEVSYMMDFWSLGVLAYEIMTGMLPFNSETPEQIFKNILNMPIELPNVGL